MSYNLNDLESMVLSSVVEDGQGVVEVDDVVVENDVVVNGSMDDDAEFIEKNEKVYVITDGKMKGKEAIYVGYDKETGKVTVDVDGVGVKRISKKLFNDIFQLKVADGEVVCSHCGKRKITDKNRRFLKRVMETDGIPEQIKESIKGLDICTGCQNHSYFYEGVKMPLSAIYKLVKSASILNDEKKLEEAKAPKKCCEVCGRELTKTELDLLAKYNGKVSNVLCAEHLLSKITKR